MSLSWLWISSWYVWYWGICHIFQCECQMQVLYIHAHVKHTTKVMLYMVLVGLLWTRLYTGVWLWLHHAQDCGILQNSPHPCPMSQLAMAVSNWWTGIWNWTMEWKMEWNSERTQLQLTCVTDPAQSLMLLYPSMLLVDLLLQANHQVICYCGLAKPDSY